MRVRWDHKRTRDTGAQRREYWAARLEVDTVHGLIPAFDWFHVVDAAVAALRPYCNARPMTSSAAAKADNHSDISPYF
jgi:hypothetical protein